MTSFIKNASDVSQRRNIERGPMENDNLGIVQENPLALMLRHALVVKLLKDHREQDESKLLCLYPSFASELRSIKEKYNANVYVNRSRFPGIENVFLVYAIVDNEIAFHKLIGFDDTKKLFIDNSKLDLSRKIRSKKEIIQLYRWLHDQVWFNRTVWRIENGEPLYADGVYFITLIDTYHPKYVGLDDFSWAYLQGELAMVHWILSPESEDESCLFTSFYTNFNILGSSRCVDQWNDIKRSIP
jgi:hypothetical protein